MFCHLYGVTVGFWDNVFGALGYAKAQPVEKPPGWLVATAQAEAYSVPDRQLPEAQLELYQRLSWVQIAVSKVAEVAATTAFGVKRLVGEDTEDISNHPFELLLRRPNPLMSRAELLEATLAYHALTGNAYWWLNRPGSKGAPTEIWVLPPHKVKPVPDGRMYLRGYTYEPDGGQPMPLELTDMVHFRRFHPLNSFVGLSPIEALNTVATGDMAMQRWNTKFFDKDNAKPGGILAFRDPIDDDTWARMKQDIKDEYGGTKRALMLLRDAGNGVNYIQAAMSQADVQFLDGRRFTQEEVYAIYAPGLASMLAVNATEANSISGRRTFVEYGVWPHLVRIAEKITNDVLPLYGDGLVGEFDDIRITDKQLELTEIAAYGQTHTVDEVRVKYYQSGPIGDERGVLLVSEVGKGLTPAGQQDEAGPARKDILGYHIESGVVTRNEARADVGLGPVDDSQDMKLRDLRAKLEIMKAATDAGIPTEQAAALVGLGVTIDTPEPPPMPALPAVRPAQPGTPDSPDTGDAERHDPGDDAQQELQEREAKALRRWLRNRKNPDPLKFKREHLSEADVLAVAGEMGIQHAVQPPAVKAMLLRLDPDDDEAEWSVRRALERRSTASIRDALREFMDTLYPDGWGGDLATAEREAIRIHNAFLADQRLNDALARALIEGVDLGVTVGMQQLENAGFGFDWTMAHVPARDWATQYTDQLLQQLVGPTEQGVGQAIARWIDNGESLDMLKQDLLAFFGPARAERIAVTEVTRAYARGATEAYRASGVVNEREWLTAQDELVCPTCGGLSGKRRGLDEAFDVGIQEPPAHVNCRCALAPVVRR